MERTVTVPQYAGTTYNDIILNTFGLTTSAGVLEVVGEVVMARARIYNTGNPAGQFAQGVPGIAKDFLGRQALLHGISGIAGSRVNVGVANPNNVPIEVGFRVSDASNTTLYSQGVIVPPHSYVQFSDIFNAFGIPAQENVTVQFNTFELPLYGYSSEVRNDTGDAVFNFGTSPNT